MRPQLFGTLFYANYLTRALALYRSLEAHFVQPFTLVALCMDELAEVILRELDLPHIRILRIGELEARFPELARVKPTRSIGEYSWTCTPALMRYMLAEVGASESVAYLDADLMSPIRSRFLTNGVITTSSFTSIATRRSIVI